MAKYVCSICGYIYDEDAGMPGAGIAPGTKFSDLPQDWRCPLCKAAKSDFVKQETAEPQRTTENRSNVTLSEEVHPLKELSFAQMSALCSNFSKGCEKQYLQEEAKLFMELAEYYAGKAGKVDTKSTEEIEKLLAQDLMQAYPETKAAAEQAADRGALRALVWSEKVSRMIQSLLKRYETEKEAMLEHTNIYVCEICGFIYIGDTPPEICPVCKVPNHKLTKIVRG